MTNPLSIEGLATSLLLDLTHLPTPSVATYLRACALEQVVADLEPFMPSSTPKEDLYSLLSELRRIALALASVNFAAVPASSLTSPCFRRVFPLLLALIHAPRDVDSVTIPASAELGIYLAKAPECLTKIPIDLQLYATHVSGLTGLRNPAVVIGLRSTGSYVAPILASLLHSLSGYVTFRPQRGSSLQLVPADQSALIASCDQPGLILLADDSISSGRTIEPLLDTLARLGCEDRIRVIIHKPRREHRVVPWAQLARRVPALNLGRAIRPPLPMTESDADNHFTRLAQALQDSVVSVARMGTHFEDLWTATKGTRPPAAAAWDAIRPHRYRITMESGRTLLAKYAGFGIFAEADLRRLGIFAGLTPRAICLTDGYLVSEYSHAQPITYPLPDNTNSALMRYLRLLQRHYISGTTSFPSLVRIPPLRVTSKPGLSLAWRATLLEATSQSVDTNISLIETSFNQSEWHFGQDGTQLVRFGTDLGHGARHTDIGRELAAYIVELDLDLASVLTLTDALLPTEPLLGWRVLLHLPNYAIETLSGYTRELNYLGVTMTDIAGRAGSPALVAYRRRFSRVQKWLRRPNPAVLALLREQN